MSRGLGSKRQECIVLKCIDVSSLHYRVVCLLASNNLLFFFFEWVSRVYEVDAFKKMGMKAVKEYILFVIWLYSVKFCIV